ncbi:MMPL family transporter [Paraconexibacter antarcticus]|uniref:MMPL family transporter n=1 Tax=Paraconexibacter antarcticus TaxID=2949664 RepID=A0ABY5DNP7_9ACTN|nr:MMPL family transporter [Paraconexibacter antarcticus]UTI63653.1 MMPL family transporter [Paraconexibacter antarcticus]
MTDPARPATSSAFVRLARVCNAHRWRTFLAWLLALAALQVVAAGVGKKEIQSFRLPGTESQRAYDLLSQHFPAQKGDTDQFVYRAKTGSLRDPQVKAEIERTLRAAAARPEVAGVITPYQPGGQITADGKIGVAKLDYRKSTNDLTAPPLEKIEKAAFQARSASLQVEHGGPGAKLIRFANSQGPSEFLGIIAAAIVLFLTFGSLVAMGLPLVSTLLAIGCSLGIITVLSHLVDTPDFATQLSLLIGIGVGIDYALFIVTRFRAEVRAGRSKDDAIETAIDTAGRTVVFAAITVVIALLGLLLLGLNFMHGVALGAAATVLSTMFAALTVLPALIGGAGTKMDGLTKKRVARRAAKRAVKAEGTGWARWSLAVQRRPWPAALLSIVLLLGMAIPALSIRLGSSDAGVDPPGSTTRAAYHLIADGFGAGTNGAFLMVAKLAKPGDRAAAATIAATLRADKDFTFVAPYALSPDGAVATINAYPRTGPQDERTTTALKRVRNDVRPGLEQKTGATIEVGGYTAGAEDFSRVVASKLPLFVGVVVLLSALLLLVVFRSVVIPVKAAAMNLLSIGAALGFVTLIFQDGHGAGLLGIGTGPIESFVPVLMFAIVFGLSMDYEVFLISRVHEEWEQTGDASGSVAHGVQSTGKVITAAASIMVLVFASFALGDDRIIKLFGVGLASAVFFDAVIIRCLLVPALMEILGRHAWYLPAWLDRRMPRLAIESSEHRLPGVPEPAPDAA